MPRLIYNPLHITPLGRYIATLVLAVLLSSWGYAQPANDDYAAASPIAFGADGFGIGTYQSDIINLTGSGNETGEFLEIGSYPNTVWYTFSIATRRRVRIQVEEPVQTMDASEAGFLVYFATPGIPGVGDRAVFTTITSLYSYSENVCLEPGDYAVQVIAKTTAASEIFVEIEVDAASPDPLDLIESPEDEGQLSDGHSVGFDWECLSIQSADEYPVLGTGVDSALYSKSAWVTFTTDDHIDMWRYVMTSNLLNGEPYHVRVYEGAQTLATLATATVVYEENETIRSSAAAGNYTYVPCLLDTMTQYTVQLTGQEYMVGGAQWRMDHLGEGPALAPFPQEIGFSPSNTFGTVVPSPFPGTQVTLTDHYACEALLTDPTTACGVVNPVDMVTLNGDDYDMTLWYTVSFPQATTVRFNVSLFSDYCNNAPTSNNTGLYLRVFNELVDNDCGSFGLGDLEIDEPFNAQGNVISVCLPAGDYAIQVLGRSGLADNTPFTCSNRSFGRRLDLELNVSSVAPLLYGIAAAGDVDPINTAIALQDGIVYEADSAAISCSATVLPDTTICDPLVDRAIYRQVTIGDADADAQLDSGMLTILDPSYWSEIDNQLVNSVFYRGDADALAQAQGLFTWPDQIDGLIPLHGCNLYDSYFYSTAGAGTARAYRKFCVTPGTYTLAQLGDSTENNAALEPRFRFDKTVTQFADPAAPEDMGDIIALGLDITSQDDFFSCSDNPVTIDGLDPCDDYTKLVYREFFLSTEAGISIDEEGESYPDVYFRVFSGRVSQVGTAGLTLAPIHPQDCYSSFGGGFDYGMPDDCTSLPVGWYTVVSYGRGPSYDNNYDFHEQYVYQDDYQNNEQFIYNIDRLSRLHIVADTTVPPGPFYNRPHKACLALDTIRYVNTGSIEVPAPSTSYTLCTEQFKPPTDTPFVDIPIIGCLNAVRTSFFVFTTDDEYYTRINGINGFTYQLYPLDVRTDSMLLPTTDPLVVCESSPNSLEVCRLEAGTYTLVIYADPLDDCVSVTPEIRVSPVERSRFDHAANAFDFGVVPGDGEFHGGPIGAVHPVHAGLLASADGFYCTTGSQPDDPDNSCSSGYYAGVYPDSVNHAYHGEPGTTGDIERNLWYTFVLQGRGSAVIKVRNLADTINASPSLPHMALYRSDVDASIPFPVLAASGEVDSTAAQGLEFLSRNRSGFCNRFDSLTLLTSSDFCSVDDTLRRYYVLVTLANDREQDINAYVDLQVKWNQDMSVPIDPVYDLYSQANVLGNDEVLPPYTYTPLAFDQLYTGGWGNLSCATIDAADIYLDCPGTNSRDRTLWWRLEVDEPGFIYMGTETQGNTNLTRTLLREVSIGDSIVSLSGVDGLADLGQGTSSTPTGQANYGWRRWCAQPGVYYYNVRSCALLDTSYVRAYAYFRPVAGDRCFNAVGTSAATNGTYGVSTTVVCHGMGDDFGEDGSDLNCLQGPAGYASTWFQFEYTGSELVDILFQPDISGLGYNPGASEVRYRLFYGDDCSTMFEGQECSTNAFINNSIACVGAAEGQFYVQVVYPEDVGGTLGFDFTVSANTNPDCNPFNPSNISSDFIFQFNCEGDSVLFTNYSTSGGALEYVWDFGDGSASSNVFEPSHTYTTAGTYTVTLQVNNPSTGDMVSSSQTVVYDPQGSPIELGADRLICLGESETLGAFVSQATYDWSTGANTATIDVSTAGDYDVVMTLNGCLYYDTVSVALTNLNFSLGPDQSICLGDTIDLAVATAEPTDYLWSTGAITQSIIVSQAGTYALSLSRGNCEVRDTVVVDLTDLSFELGPDALICQGDSLLLNPVTAAMLSFDWSTGSVDTFQVIQSAGQYSLSVTDGTCAYADAIEVTVLDLAVELGPDTTICAGSSFALDAETNATVNYLWDTGSTASTLAVNSAGMRYLRVDSAGCFARDSVAISVLDLAFELPPDTILCAGASLSIDAAAFLGSSYDWSTGSSAASIVVNSSGLYALTIDSIGCEASDDIDVEVLDLSFSLGPDTTICAGSSVSLFTAPASGLNYLWSTGFNSNILVTDTAGLYSLTVSRAGCSFADDVQVSVFAVDAALPSPLEICLNATAQVTVVGADSIAYLGPINPFTRISPVTLEYTAEQSSNLILTAYENGCEEAINLQTQVIQPFIPLLDIEPTYCINAPPISLDEPAFTTGDFSLGANVVTVLEPASLELGDTLILYTYVDTNFCANSITAPIEILDTTAVAWLSLIGDICIDGAAYDLSSAVSHSPADLTVDYSLLMDSTWQITAFDPDSIVGFENAVEEFAIRYRHTNAAGCESKIMQNVAVHPLPTADLSAHAACLNVPLVITSDAAVVGSTISSYAWDVEAWGTSIEPILPGLQFDAPDTLSISLELLSTIGCFQRFEDEFVIHPLPLSAFDFEGICEGDISTFIPTSALATGMIASYQWTIEGSTIPSLASVDYSFGAWGDQPVSLSTISDQGCRDTLTTTVFIHPLPLGDIQLSDHCLASGTVISGFPTIPLGTIDSLQWSLSDGYTLADSLSFAYQFDVPGSYTVMQTLRSDMGCSSSSIDTVIVYPHPQPMVALTSDSVCIGAELRWESLSTIAAPSTIAAYAWESSCGFSSDAEQFVFTPTMPGAVSVSLQLVSDSGCEASLIDTTSAAIYGSPVADFVLEETSLNLDAPQVILLDLSSSDVTSWYYDWGDDSYAEGPNPPHYYEAIGEYIITQIVTNANGCRDTAYAAVSVEGLLIWIPNAFTPDGDGTNDMFHPEIYGEPIREYEFAIWDRWGERIFYTEDYSRGWDGGGTSPSTGQEERYYVQDGVYTYTLKVVGELGALETRRGSITLIR